MSEVPAYLAAIFAVKLFVEKCIDKGIDHIFKNRSSDKKDILDKIKRLENFYKLEAGQQEALTSAVTEAETAIKAWFRNSNNGQITNNEKYILKKIESILLQLKANLRSNQDWESKKRTLKQLLLCLNLLESRYDYLYLGQTGALIEPLREETPDESIHDKQDNPPNLYLLSLFGVPIIFIGLFLFIFGPLKDYRFSFSPDGIGFFPPKRTTPSPPQPDLDHCPLASGISKFEKDLKKRMMAAINDPGFEEILTKDEKKQVFTPSEDSKSNGSSKQRQTASNFLKSIELYQQQYEVTQFSNKLDRIKPLLYIFQNNEEIDRRVEASRSDSSQPHVFQIAVAVPFGPGRSDGPMPWGLGILRGVDIAQKFILDKSKRILLKVIVADDYFENEDLGDIAQPKSKDFAHYLAIEGYNDEKLVGLVGHQQPNIAKKVSKCYEMYKFPALTTVIQSQSIKGKGVVQSLLPSSEEMAKIMIEAMENAPESSSRDRITVFYDKSDLSSKEMMEKICAASKDAHYSDCRGYDIANAQISDDLINKKINHYDEWFLAVNPFAGSESNTNIRSRIIDIINAYANNGHNVNTKNRLYLGHNFIDEELVNGMITTLRAAGNVALFGKNSRNAWIWRFSPWDWRSRNSYKSKSFNDYYRRYGTKYNETLNWYSVTAFNSMLFFYQAIDLFDNASSNSPSDIRTSLVGFMSADRTYDLSGRIPYPIRISIKNKTLTIGGDGSLVCLVNMTNTRENSICD